MAEASVCTLAFRIPPKAVAFLQTEVDKHSTPYGKVSIHAVAQKLLLDKLRDLGVDLEEGASPAAAEEAEPVKTSKAPAKNGTAGRGRPRKKVEPPAEVPAAATKDDF